MELSEDTKDAGKTGKTSGPELEGMQDEFSLSGGESVEIAEDVIEVEEMEDDEDYSDNFD
jgi:hypothetical protein